MTSTNMTNSKHVNDVCRLNQESTRSAAVKGLSLDWMIAEKKVQKIANTPPRSDVAKNDSNSGGPGTSRGDPLSLIDCSVDDLNLSLDDVIKRRRAAPKPDKEIKADADKSLEEIIQEKKKTEAKEKAKLEVDKDVKFTGGVIVPFIAAPLDVLMKLTDKGLVIQSEIGKLAEEEETLGRIHKWRAKYSCGDVVVRCDSSRKNLAKQGAAHQFLTELKAAEPRLEIPDFKIPEAAYFDPAVVNRLEELVAVMSLGPASYETVQSRMSQHDYFTTTYFIREDEFSESSFDPDHSKLLAAKEAYEVFSGKTFPRDSFLVGEKCAPGLKYDVRETEATHCITLNTVPTMMMSGTGMGEESYNPASTALTRNRKRPSEGKLEPTKRRDPEAAEIFVDDLGQMYVRSRDNSNKVRKISLITLDDYAALACEKFGGIDNVGINDELC